MGHIRKQTIYSSAIIYFGFIIGAFNLLILFPRLVGPEYLGLTKVIQDYAVILTSLAGLGFGSPFYRFSPFYNAYSKKGSNDLLQLYLVVIHLGILIVFILGIVLKPMVTGYFNFRSPLFSQFYYCTFVFGYLLMLYNVLEMYLFSRGQAVWQSLSREIVIRLVISLMVISLWFGFSKSQFIWLFSMHYLIPVLLLVWVIWKYYPAALGIQFSKVTSRLIPHMYGMAGYGIIQTIITSGVPVIDTIVVGGVVGLPAVAEYLLLSYISTLVHVPVRATANLLGARLAELWKNSNVPKIQTLYQRTSMSYLTFALFAVSIILINIDLFQKLIGKNINISAHVLYILIAAKIFELSTGLSNLIIGYSKKWKIETIINIANILLAIPLNIIFVTKYGILGAAISNLSLAALTFSARMWILYKVYGLFPYQKSTLILLGFGLPMFVLFYWVCHQTDLILIKLLGSLIYAACFLSFILKMRLSEDLNLVVETFISRILRLRQKP